ncbi:caspase family protein [Candidatus Sulfidibacterium hydrothermale]|uniref:caspase family protein n=1 Tax=Candidatus Sulfidibacterium hydrothermale TaxID=2875962 RepID=UPI001F0A6958|nr:caspase family protein [Candidatus Sulfidibacterium hydrothermale]UBM61309.1 caspase family protein [Candidatus Sulfidibacterium hydrothermale]
MNALALIIGNADYNQEKDKLINAVNDANDFARKLVNLGFVVNKITNCNREQFDREVRKFGEDLKKFDIGLFYFSGHGLQIKGKNYLTAIDTSFADDISAIHTSFPLDEIIDYMQAAKPIIKILILDACRNNPLPSQYRSINSEGLAPIYAPKGTIIAFSTSPGEKAMDYGAGRNSIYTGALLNHIDDINVPIEDFFKRVRTTVYTLSNGKQTSWEHTSLIGNFYFNSGQLIHSIDLPYKKEHIADELFNSNGSEIEEIIKDLKSHDWYQQSPAINKLNRIDKNSIDESMRFLLGRNILQTAIGGEFAANSIIKNLDEWLNDWFTGEENHVLNGILFEIYFNSKGQFRQRNFKANLIDDIFKLEKIERFKFSFDFIGNQLNPFHEYLFYIPSHPPKTLPIELQFEKEKYMIGEKERTIHRLVSIKLHDIEIMEPYENNDFNTISVSFDKFQERLKEILCVPVYRLRLSMNVEKDSLKIIHIPWELKVNKMKQ